MDAVYLYCGMNPSMYYEHYRKHNEMNIYVFGPVPSRRLGRSLGIDLVPFKTCTYDCVYCQLGRTTNRTIERKEWVPLDAVLKQVREKLSSVPDYITLSGSGEPTLFSKLSELIEGIKEITEIPIAILTNGSLLCKKEVRDSLKKIDLIIPSLDAGDSKLFNFINRPYENISFSHMVNGLIDFRNGFSGQFWLEVMLLGGLNSVPADFKKIMELIRRINPDKIQLNTVVRPPAEQYAYPVSLRIMQELRDTIGNNCEVITDRINPGDIPPFESTRKDIFDLLARRPCTVEDIVSGLGIYRNEAIKYIDVLCRSDRIEYCIQNGNIFYKPFLK